MESSRFPAAVTMGIILAAAACADAPPPREPAAVVTVTAAPRSPEALTPPPPAPPPPEEKPDPRHRVSLQLDPKGEPCTLAFEAPEFADHDDFFYVAGITRITTEASSGCAAGVLFDVAAGRERGDTTDPDSLAGGMFQKPSRPAAPEMADDFTRNLILDLDFDGRADLCVVTVMGPYNYGQKCWLFDAASRTFARSRELDEVIFMKLDPGKKTISNGYRGGGSMYVGNEYAWIKGKLVQTRERAVWLGGKPSGEPLPPGFAHWARTRVLRGGKLVTVSEGPQRAAPP